MQLHTARSRIERHQSTLFYQKEWIEKILIGIRFKRSYHRLPIVISYGSSAQPRLYRTELYIDKVHSGKCKSRPWRLDLDHLNSNSDANQILNLIPECHEPKLKSQETEISAMNEHRSWMDSSNKFKSKFRSENQNLSVDDDSNFKAKFLT